MAKKRGFSNRKAQAQNEEVWKLYYERLHDICLSYIKWTGLPFPDLIVNEIAVYLNEILYQGHTAGLIFIDDQGNADEGDRYIPVIGQAVQSDGVTWYGGSNRYIIQTKNSVFHVRRENVALCKPSPANRNLYEVAARYATLLTQADMSTHVNMVNQNTPAIIQSPPGQELTYANLFEQIAGFKPVVYGREGLIDKGDNLFAYRYLQPATYVADKLEMLKHDLMNDFFNELGVSAKSIEKRAQLISDELNIDFTSNSLMKNVFLDQRLAFCDECLEIFGINVDAEYNCDVLYAGRDMEIETLDNAGGSGDANREGRQESEQ